MSDELCGSADEVLMRLRAITEKPYAAKHGRPMTWERGWCWEMVSFIHHAVDAYHPPGRAASIKTEDNSRRYSSSNG